MAEKELQGRSFSGKSAKTTSAQLYCPITLKLWGKEPISNGLRWVTASAFRRSVKRRMLLPHS